MFLIIYLFSSIDSEQIVTFSDRRPPQLLRTYRMFSCLECQILEIDMIFMQ